MSNLFILQVPTFQPTPVPTQLPTPLPTPASLTIEFDYSFHMANSILQQQQKKSSFIFAIPSR
jgi:hypothetical protein